MAKTKKPSGLSIARDGMKFACSWKVSDEDYDSGIQFQYRTNLFSAGVWSNAVSLLRGTTSRTISLSASNFYPTTKDKLSVVSFRVRGKRKPVTKTENNITTTTTYDWSDWEQKNYDLNLPSMPVLTAELSSSVNNVTVFSWDTPVSTTNSRPFAGIEWQTRLVKACSITKGEKVNWKSGTRGWNTGTSSSASGSINTSYTTEDTEALASGSYTRWVRIRSRGANGASGWRYAKHVYAKPYVPVINEVKVTKGSLYTTCKITWTAKTDVAHPIDSVTAQYLIAKPESGLAAPANGSWSDGATVADTSGKDAVQFTVDDVPGEDECMWVRLIAHHDHESNDTYSTAKRVAVGALKAPTISSLTTDVSTNRITISVEHESEVPDSRIAVIFRLQKYGSQKQTERTVGIIAHNTTEATIQCPDWDALDSIDVGIYEFQGTATDNKGSSDTVHKYAVSANMKSATVWRGGDVPRTPTTFTGRVSDLPGEVILTWNFPWALANRSELSWSKNPNAWESTDQPQTYVISGETAGKWRVSGLETGVTWYFRVRLGREVDGETAWGAYTDNVEVDLSDPPETPLLSLSAGVISRKDKFTATWQYIATDGTRQAYAEVREATVNGETVTVGSLIAKTETAQSVTIKGSKWSTGTEHYLVVRVTSSSGKRSGWSDPVSIAIADPVTCDITATSLVTETIETDDGVQRSVTSLKSMPLTATITGAGAGGTTTLIIERAEDYHMIRPDGTEYDGFEGETIALIRQDGESQISVDVGDLIGILDDGAPYRLIGVSEDSYGQSAQDEIEFEVHWTHQAEQPTATVVMDGDVAKITPIAPAGVAEGDVCDIYRLSVDPPELIVQNGEFGSTYVDPYPAIGEAGGHRIVHRTINGDYITEANQPAWIDLGADDGDLLEADYGIIDFDGDKINVRYNMSMDNSWEKDFQKTKYLGGSQQGDWNPGVSRSGSVGAVISTSNIETMQAIRRLAEYTGICHVRTQDGSSYAADVQVSDGMSYEKGGNIMEYTLTITRVDPEGFDGVILEQWEAEVEEE